MHVLNLIAFFSSFFLFGFFLFRVDLPIIISATQLSSMPVDELQNVE